MRDYYDVHKALSAISREINFDVARVGTGVYELGGIEIQFNYKIDKKCIKLIYPKSMPLCKCEIKGGICEHYIGWLKEDIEHFDIVVIGKNEVIGVIADIHSLF